MDGATNERVWSLAYHAQGFLVGCLGGTKNQLVFWNEGDEKPFHAFPLPNSAHGMCMDSEGIRVAMTHADSKLRITRLATKA